MRSVVVYELMSVDGVAEEPDRFFADWDDAMDANLAKVIATQDTVVLGRRSYEQWADFWPTSDIEPFASFINAVEKVVATSTPLDRTWAHARAIDGDLVEHIRELKRREGGDIGVHASISVARSLMAAGVVDELRLAVFPAVAGSGQRLLDDLPPMHLQNVGTTVSASGSVLAHYRLSEDGDRGGVG